MARHANRCRVRQRVNAATRTSAPVRHVVLTEEGASGVLAQPAGTDVAMVGIEHDAPATRLLGEYACHDARQVSGRPRLTIFGSAIAACNPARGDRRHIGWRWESFAARKFDITVVLAAETTDEDAQYVPSSWAPDTAASATTASRTPTPAPDAGGLSTPTPCRRLHRVLRGGWHRARPGSAWAAGMPRGHRWRST